MKFKQTYSKVSFHKKAYKCKISPFRKVSDKLSEKIWREASKISSDFWVLQLQYFKFNCPTLE